MKKAKVGLIVDNKSQSWNIKNLIEQSLDSQFYEICCIIVQNTDSIHNKKTSLKNYAENILFRAICFVERIIVRRNPLFKNFYKKFNLNSIDIQKIEVNPIVSKSGYVYRYSDFDINQIEKQDLDILIRGGSGILQGKILRICKKGIISFHHGNNDINRGSPPGFWEVMKRQKSSGFIIQILKEELDAGDVIFKGSIPTSFFYSLNAAKLYLKANIFMHKILEDIFSNKELKIYSKKPYDQILFKLPTIAIQLAYILKTGRYILFKIYRKLISRHLKWNVAYQYSKNWKDAVIWKSKIVKNPTNRFLADPFLFNYGGKDFCFVEDYNYSLKKGLISVFEINQSKETNIEIVLDESFHLSYPFIFDHNEQIYMCPETSEIREVRLYKCLDFPLKWELEKVLLSDISAVDTNIFKHENKWWLLTNIDTSNSGDHCSELHLYSSDDLLSDKWVPHPLNPIIFDSEKARNGGLIFEKDKIYRVYQKQGWDNYGEGLGVSRITKINDSEYHEDSEFEISASFFKNIKGTHTYNFNNGILAIDFSSIQKVKKY